MANEVNDVFRVTPTFRVAEQTTRIQNVFYVQAFALNDPTDATVLANCRDIILNHYNTIQDFVTETFTGEDVRVTNVTKRERVGVIGLTFQGTDVTTEPLPPQTAAEVLVPLKAVGRTGRKYIGPLAENAQDAGVLTAAAIAALDNFHGQMTTNHQFVGDANDYDVGIARFNGKVLLDYSSYFELTGRTIDTLRTQRRRTAGFGLT